MDIEEAIGHAKRGRALLFTGAGFSRGARNALQEPENSIPDAKQFARRLANSLGSSGEYTLPVVSQAYIRKGGGENGLLRELLNCFTVTGIERHHKIIADVPWVRVYTTNYDNCFEFAALQSGSEWTPMTINMAVSAAKKRCVHINGHVSNLTIESLAKQIKLTHSSYSAEDFADSQWAQQLRQDANAAKSVFLSVIRCLTLI